MLQLTKIRSDKDKYAKREYSAANFIPFLCHWNSKTILTKAEELVQVIRVSGFSFETADDEDLDIRKNLRNTLFKGLETGGITLYFHIVRRRESIFASSESALRKAKSNRFVEYVDYEWQKKTAWKRSIYK